MRKKLFFHPGELHFQEKSGVEAIVAKLAPRLIQSALSEQHQTFFAQQTLLFVGSVDESGQPWASVIAGELGFIRVTNSKTICINASPVKGDPLSLNLEVGTQLGFLGIEFETRRRNRISGTVKQKNANNFSVKVNKAFGNCPKYIQSRRINVFVENEKNQLNNIQRIQSFDEDVSALVSSCDTFFISSFSPHDENHHVDVSHRGGKPGFVQIINDRTFVVDDYSGNNLFMTLGNLYSNPLAGLLFIDFKTGDTLQLACTCGIAEAVDETRLRQLRFTLKQGWLIKSAFSIRSDFLDYSRFL